MDRLMDRETMDVGLNWEECRHHESDSISMQEILNLHSRHGISGKVRVQHLFKRVHCILLRQA